MKLTKDAVDLSDLELWLRYLDTAGTLRDLLDDLGRLCTISGHPGEPLKEVCLPLDFPVLAEKRPLLARQLMDNFPACLAIFRRLLYMAAHSLELPGASGLMEPQQLLVEARVFQFPCLDGVASAGRLAGRLGKLCCWEGQIVSVWPAVQCNRALRYLCRDPMCPFAVSKRPLIIQRCPGDDLATTPGAVVCSDCSATLHEDASGRVQADALRFLALPAASARCVGVGGVGRAIRCVAIGNRLTRRLQLGRRYRLLGLPLRRGSAVEFELVDCETLVANPSCGLAVARGLDLPSNLAGSRYGTALYAAYYLGSDASPPGSWMTVKLTVLLMLLGVSSGMEEAGSPDDEEQRLQPLSLCLMSPGDFNSVRRWLQAVCDRLGPSGVTHRCGATVAAAARQTGRDGGQAIDAGTLAMAGPGGVSLFPQLAVMRPPDLRALAWAMESGRLGGAGGAGSPHLACGVIALMERGACGSGLAPEADGCYGNAAEEDAPEASSASESLGYKRELGSMRRELRSLLSRFQLYLECEEPGAESAAQHYLDMACSGDSSGGGCMDASKRVTDLVLAQRHLQCEFGESAAAALQRHFMAGRRVFEAKRVSFGKHCLATITRLAVGHARLNCRPTVLPDDVLLAAYLLEVSAYCLHGSSHFAISYLGHLDRLVGADLVAEFDANLAEFGAAVDQFMQRERITESSSVSLDLPEE